MEDLNQKPFLWTIFQTYVIQCTWNVHCTRSIWKSLILAPAGEEEKKINTGLIPSTQIFLILSNYGIQNTL